MRIRLVRFVEACPHPLVRREAIPGTSMTAAMDVDRIWPFLLEVYADCMKTYHFMFRKIPSKMKIENDPKGVFRMTTDMRSQFDQYIENFKQNTSKEVQDKMRNAIDELENSEEGNGLSEGEKAPDFTLPDAKGGQVQLSEQLKFGPVIVTFYRGGWCPYCNMELRAYQEILDDIHKEGAQLIAISPQTPDQSMTTQEKNDLQYHVLSDVGNKAARQFNLVYKLPDYLVEVYKDKGLNVDKHNGDDSWTLPVSATYIIDTDGSIVYEYTKSDYKDRAEPSEVLQELKKVKA